MKEELLDLKFRSMRDTEKIQMPAHEAEEISFERVHRTGPKLSHKQPIRIVEKFSSYKQREAVRALGKNFKDTNFYVNEQLITPEIVEQRKKPYGEMKKAPASGKTAYIPYNKLYVDGALYRPTDAPPRQSLRRVFTSCSESEESPRRKRPKVTGNH